MPIFNYTAKDIEGQYHRGEVDAVDQSQVADLLRRKKLIVISIKIKNQTTDNFLSKTLQRVSFSEVVIMTRQLATMISAGLVLSEALDILEEQQTNKRFKKVLGEISSDVKGGMDLSSSLEKYPDVFPSIYSRLIQAGQSSGKLDTILQQLATNLEKEREFKSKVKGAMIYPVVVISMMVGVMMIMVFFVMPKLISLYSESSIELPLPTKIMLGISNLMISFWWAFILIIIVAVMFLKRYLSTPEGKLIFDRLILRTPVVKRVVNLVILTNFTRTFALLVASGIAILDSIKIVGNLVGNQVYKDGLNVAYKGVERGLPFSTQLLGLPVFPKIIGQMVRTGEETGKLDEVMFKIADYFESESDNALKNITTLIEPIIIVVLGIGVAFLVVSVILPIYQLTTSIQ